MRELKEKFTSFLTLTVVTSALLLTSCVTVFKLACDYGVDTTRGVLHLAAWGGGPALSELSVLPGAPKQDVLMSSGGSFASESPLSFVCLFFFLFLSINKESDRRMRIFLIVAAPPRQSAMNRLVRVWKETGLLELIPDQREERSEWGDPSFQEFKMLF